MTRQDVINHLIVTPGNTNKNVLKSLLSGLENINEIIDYILFTPENVNANILNYMIPDEFSNGAKVGSAKVGTAKAE